MGRRIKAKKERTKWNVERKPARVAVKEGENVRGKKKKRRKLKRFSVQVGGAYSG